MRILKYSLTILIMLTVFAGCKKYPDDNVLIQWHKPEKRILGTYNLKSFTVNNNDSTQVALSVIQNNGTIYFGTPAETQYNTRIAKGPVTIADGVYKFTDKKNKLSIIMALHSGRNVEAFLSQDLIYWDIEELTKNTLKLKTVYNNLENKLWLEKL